MSRAIKIQLDRPIVQLVLTAALVIAAFLARQTMLRSFGIDLPEFILFYPAIMLVALLFGLWAGLLATTLTAVLAALWVFAPAGGIGIQRLSDVIAIGLFFSMGAFISVLAERYRRGQRKIAVLEREKALLETREQVQRIAESRRLALEAANLGAWDYHLDTGEVVWDERCRNDFGFRTGDSIDYAAAIASIHPEDRAATDEAVKQAIAGANDGAYTQEYRVVWPDGSVHWISSHGKVYFDGEGAQRRATRFIGINTDITERRQGEEQRRASEQRYRLLAETMLQGVVHQDAGGKIIAMNPAAENILGWTHKQYLGMTSVQVDNLTIREDGSPFPGEEHPAMVALRTGRVVRDVAMGIWNARTDSRRWINITAVPLFRPGETAPYQVYAVFEDISERKQAESAIETILQRFYAILSNLYSGVVLVTDEGRVEFANQAFCDIFELGELPVDLAGLGSNVMVAKIKNAYRYPDQAEARLQEIVDQGIPVTGEELPMRDGGTCLRDYVPLNVDGKSYGRMWVHTDITELKRVETRLRRFYETDLFAVLYWKIDGEVVDVNDRFLKMTGYGREDVRAGLVNWTRITPPEYQALDEDARREVRETGIHQPYEKEFIRKDGTRVSVEIWAAAYEDDRTQGVSFALDITERKLAENELRAAKRDWERTFNSVPDLIAILDNEHRIVRANRPMAQRLGTVPEACVGLECFACVHGTAAPITMCPHSLTLKDGLEHSAELHEDRLGGDFLVTTTPLLNDRGEMDGTVHVARDITERKRVEEALRESEKRYRNLFNAMNEGFCIIEMLFDANGKPQDYRFVEVNAAFERQTGLHDAVGKLMRELAPANEEFWFEIYGRVALTGEPAHFMDEAAALNRWYDVHAYRIGEPEQRRVAIVFNDFSDYKRAEEALQKSEEQFRTLANAIPQLCWTANADGWITWYNRRWYEYTGTTPEQMEGWGWQSLHDPEVLPRVLERWGVSVASGTSFEMVFPLRSADGVFRPFLTRVMPLKDADGNVMRWFGTNTDISEQKQIEAELRTNQERLNIALDVAQLGEWERDLKTNIGSRSLRLAQIFGYATVESGWNFEAFLSHVLPQFRAKVTEWHESSLTGGTWEIETQIRRADGAVRWIWLRSHTRLDEAGQPAHSYGIAQDITDRKLVEERLQRLNRTLKALSNCNQALLHSADEAAFLHEVCRIITEDCGYSMVWIGFAESDERKMVRPVASAGNVAGYLDQFDITWDLSPTGLGPTGTAIRTGLPKVCRNMNTDPAFAPWRAEATKRGYASSLVIPLREGEGALGAITIYSGVPDAFSEGEVNLLTELAGDLMFGIRTLRMRAAHAEAEAALRESEEQLGLFVEHAPVALAMFDNQMRYLRASRRWKSDYGLGDRALHGLSHYEAFPEISEQWKENHRRALAGEVLHHDADRFERADGSVQWVRWEMRPWKDSEGEIGGILSFSEEITDRKHAEDALREQAELLDLAHDTIMVYDLDGTIRFWNHGAEEMYGYTREEATGKNVHKLLSTVFPQPIDEIKARTLLEGRWEGELAQVTRQGTGMIAESRWVVQRDKDGSARAIMEINNDITTRVRAEEAQRESHLKLQSVLDSITDGLFMLDHDWHYTYFSEHGARMLRLRAEDLVGGCVWDLFPHAESSRFGELCRRAVESREPAHFEEFYPEPLNMWLECHCYPTNEGLSVYFRDISERKRTEEALLRSEKLASVGRMAATIAHEINNPLAAITNTLYLARMQADQPASVREFLDVAEDELKRITHITRQTLGFYRESSSPMPVSVNEVLDSALDLMKSKIGTKRALIEKDWEAEATVWAIAGELRQVFSNLLGNSLDAIDEGGTIKLRVSSGADFKDGRRTVRVAVADNGKGIAESSKPRIFEPFFTTKGTVGTGLGLWVTKQIIDKHHGKVRMRSCPDGARRGTVFMVSLPVEQLGMAEVEA